MQQNTSSHVISWDDMSMRWKCESCSIGGSRAYGKKFMDSLAKPCSDPVVTAAVPAKAAKRKIENSSGDSSAVIVTKKKKDEG